MYGDGYSRRGGDRMSAPLALGATRTHAVVYRGVRDQEEGVIECPVQSIDSWFRSITIQDAMLEDVW